MSQNASSEQADRSDVNSQDHHVRFDSSIFKNELESDSSVTYTRTCDTIAINLGFLQVNHRYLIDLKLPASLFSSTALANTTSSKFKPIVNTVPNLHCSIREFTGLKHDEHNIYEMKIEFFAYKEKLMRESLTIVNAKNSEEVFKLMLSARVLGKGKGTPMLRNGIHCIGTELADNDNESSDSHECQGDGN